jgi:hypothetical protein
MTQCSLIHITEVSEEFDSIFKVEVGSNMFHRNVAKYI